MFVNILKENKEMTGFYYVLYCEFINIQFI